MSLRISVLRSTLHDLPRAGINIGDGCWGGHRIQDCDIFDTVKETGDHGSFNSWGRERYWLPDIEAVNRRRLAHPDLTPELDTIEPIVLRHNRWRCDHGWDIDLDDGSSRYVLEDNLSLNGGIKLREGYRRVVRNNIMVNNSFHPHVWFRESGDVFRGNIVMRPYAPIGMPARWGSEVDRNLLPDALTLIRNRELGLDAHSSASIPEFRDPAHGDFTPRRARALRATAFRGFSMDSFGVRTPRLRARAGTPVFPVPTAPPKEAGAGADTPASWQGATLQGIRGAGEISATGLPGEVGVRVTALDVACPAASAGLRRQDVILTVGDAPVTDAADLVRRLGALPANKDAELRVWRNQSTMRIRVRGTPATP